MDMGTMDKELERILIRIENEEATKLAEHEANQYNSIDDDYFTPTLDKVIKSKNAKKLR